MLFFGCLSLVFGLMGFTNSGFGTSWMFSHMGTCIVMAAIPGAVFQSWG